jgi:predicted RNA-binding protein YlqC (UPF0109 family)
MELVELTEFLVKNLVEDPDTVSVKQFASTEEEEVINIEVLVAESDMGRVIGRSGNVAKAIRTIVQAAAYTNGEKRVHINIESF